MHCRLAMDICQLLRFECALELWNVIHGGFIMLLVAPWPLVSIQWFLSSQESSP